MSTKKNLIIHVTDSSQTKRNELRSKLHMNGDFKRTYDGWESTVDSGVNKSTRFYYYGIEHPKLVGMLKLLHRVGQSHEYKIRINPSSSGNHAFD